jgi:hypothetical protein
VRYTKQQLVHLESLTLREEHTLRAFENRVLRRIFGHKREEMAGGWRRLHSEEFHNLHTSPNTIRVIKSRRMRWTGYVVRMGYMRRAYKMLIGKPEWKRQLGRPGYKGEDNIRMGLRETEWEVVNWMHLAPDRDQWRDPVNMVMNIRVP